MVSPLSKTLLQTFDVLRSFPVQNTMARHAENCNGEIDDAENGTPTPKRGRRGRKRKMRSRRDEEEDSGELGARGLV